MIRYIIQSILLAGLLLIGTSIQLSARPGTPPAPQAPYKELAVNAAGIAGAAFLFCKQIPRLMGTISEEVMDIHLGPWQLAGPALLSEKTTGILATLFAALSIAGGTVCAYNLTKLITQN